MVVCGNSNLVTRNTVFNFSPQSHIRVSAGPVLPVASAAGFETAVLYLCSDRFETKVAAKVLNPPTQHLVWSPTSSTSKKDVITLLILIIFFSSPLYLNLLSLYFCLFSCI